MTVTSTTSNQTPEAVLQQLHWRYAVKSFDPTRKIPDDLWQTLEQSLVLAPSSFGLQPWKFFVITDLSLRQQLVEHSWGQNQVADASHLVVFAVKKGLSSEDVNHYIQRIAEVRNAPIESLEGFSNTIKGSLGQYSDPAEIDIWSTKQVYIALGQFMTCAAMLGVDTCPMEGFVPNKYDEILGLTQRGYHAVVLCPAGYRAADDKYATLAKVRFPIEEVVEYLTP
jgi:nitroreductase